MEETERLFKEKLELESHLPEIEEAEMKVVTGPDLRELVIQVEMSKIVFEVNDQRTKDFQKELNVKVSAIRSPRRQYFKRHAEICQQLNGLTMPIIREFVTEISDHNRRGKLNSDIIKKEYSGLTKTTFLTVKSNRDALVTFRKMIDDAVATLEGMRWRSIAEIQEKARELLQGIQDFDWKAEMIFKVDEAIYFKTSAPEGLGPSTAGYAGPLSGLDLPPIMK